MININDLPFGIGSGRLLTLSNDNNPWRLTFHREEDASLSGEVWFGPELEGPPGHVHGGISAFILDEAMGSAGWLRGYPCVAAKIEVEFLAMTPVQKDLKVKAWVDSVESNKLTIQASIFADKVYSRSTGIFSRLGREFVERFAQQSAPNLDLEKFHYKT